MLWHNHPDDGIVSPVSACQLASGSVVGVTRCLSTLDELLMAAQLVVGGLRARVRLDQARLTDMLRGLDAATLGATHAATVAGLLACLGDLAAISFLPHVSGMRPSRPFAP